MHDRVASDPTLSATRHRILTLILRHLAKGQTEPTYQTIANESGVNRRTVIRAVAWLSEHGYLMVTKRHDSHGYQTANGYQPGPVSLGVTPSVTPSVTPCLSDTRVTPVSLQRRETTNPSMGLGSSETKVEEKDLSVDLSTQSDAREEKPSQIKSSLRSPENHTEITPSRPGAPLAVAAESAERPPSRTGAAHVLHDPPLHRMTAIETVLDRLDRVQRTGTNTLASCPVASHGKGNGDRNPSLSVTERDGRVLMHCMSGCLVDDILATIGLDFPDLWDEPLAKEVKVSEYTYVNRSGDPYFIAERWQSAKGKRFVQRLPESSAAGLDGLKPALYQLPRVLAAAAAHQPIWVVEGEKCVHAIETLGVVATTGPGGAAHWRDYFCGWLAGASVVNIVADNDDAGKKHAAMVMAACKQQGIPVRAWKVAVEGEKADIYDHVIAGKTIADLLPLRLNPTKPEGINPRRLRHTEYPPRTWVIPGMLPTGTAVLAGEPKSGKSLMTLDWGIGVASGHDTMHQVATNQGSVLYLSLDNDSEPRLQHRYEAMGSSLRNLDDLPIEFHIGWPTGMEAIAAVVEWAEIEEQEERRPRLVVADTLTMIEPGWENGPGGQTGYSHTVRVMHRWNQLAQDLDVAIVFVHHTRKSQQNGSSNWKERILGSQGLSATINTILMLDNSKTQDNILHIAGRDVGAQDLEIARDGLLWNCIERPHVDRPHLSVVRHP